MLLELEIPLGLSVVLVGTVVVTFGASADAFWGGEAGILSVLSVLEGSLDWWRRLWRGWVGEEIF